MPVTRAGHAASRRLSLALIVIATAQLMVVLDTTIVNVALPLREEVVRPQRTVKGKESTHSPPVSTYSAPGGLRQDPGRAA